MLNIIGKRNYFFIVSAILTAVSIAALILFGLKPGIDFTGGSLVELTFSQQRPEMAEFQTAFGPLNLGTIVTQPIGEDGYLVKTRFITEEEHQNMLQLLREKYENDQNKVLEERIETIGPAISSQLRQRAFSVTLATIIAIGLYIAYAFRKVSRPVKSWKYGIAAIIALLHDVLITVGVFAFLGKYLHIEVDIPFVVAVLTVAGYSVNDTIVVFDRVRENLIKSGTVAFEEVVNRGINETLLRSLNTSFAILLVSLALFFFGGETIHYFSLALIVGILAGTYSSIFIASTILVAWEKWSR